MLHDKINDDAKYCKCHLWYVI